MRRYGYYDPCFWKTFELEQEYKDVTAIMTVPQNGKAWQLMVRPYRDLFCLIPKDWKSTTDWQTIFDHLPFSSQYRGYGPVRHIAVEFEPSWNLNWPECLHDLLDEPTARGFVARAVEAYASKKMEFSIWLIDRYPCLAHRKPLRARKSAPKVFYDCNQEYIEIDLVECIMEDDKEWIGDDKEFSQTALYFVYRLGRLGHMEYTDMGLADTLSWDGYSFDVEDCLGVLTCREFRNEELYKARGSCSIV